MLSEGIGTSNQSLVKNIHTIKNRQEREFRRGENMNTRKKLIEVDIKKENPLMTIIRHGKIPVVQMSAHPFQNKRVEYWYKIHDGLREETIKWYQEIIKNHKENGFTNITYCNIGGCLGHDFSHWLCPIENMNIGYLEPDELVYDETSKTYITAERKFRSIEKAWASLLKRENEEEIVYGKWSYDNEHFADFQEVWCDSKRIKKVITIKVDDYLQLLPYVKDGYLSLSCLTDIFHAVSDKLDSTLLRHLDETNLDKEWENKCNRDFENDDIYGNHGIVLEYLWDYAEFYDGYKRMVLTEFQNYYSGKPFAYEPGYFKKLKEHICRFYDYLKNYKAQGERFFLNYYWFGEEYLMIQLSNYNKFISIKFNHGTFEVYDYHYGCTEAVLKEKLFSNNYRPMMYEYLAIFEEFYQTFSKFDNIEYPDILKELMVAKKYEDIFKEEKYEYVVNDKEYRLEFPGENFKLEYDLRLKDAVIEIGHSNKEYYNIETLPEEYRCTLLNRIIKTLKLENENIPETYNVRVLGDEESYFQIGLTRNELDIVNQFITVMNQKIHRIDRLSISFQRERKIDI